MFGLILIQNNMEKIQQLLTQLEVNISNAERINNAISAVPVGWHIEHSLLVLNSVAEALRDSDPAEYKRKFSIWKLIVFTTNKIPRGRAKSPARVLPKGDGTKESLNTLLHLTTKNLEAAFSLPPNHWFRHPIFGALNVKPAFKFMGIHTNHHLQIIKDITAAN